MKKNLATILISTIFLTYFSFPVFAESYRIAAGPKNSSYEHFGKQLTQQISKSDNKKKSYLIESSGSIENISLLRNGIADLAILQQNIAAEAYFSEQSPYKGFEVLGPVYPEILQIIAFGKEYKKNKLLSISEISALLKLKNIEKVYVDGQGTASHLAIVRLLALHGVGESIPPYSFIPDNHIKECKTICLAIIVDRFLSIFDVYPVKEASYVQVTIQEYLDLANRMQGFDLFQISQEEKPPFLALGTWAIVVAGHTLDNSKHDTLKIFIENYIFHTQKSTSQSVSVDVSVVEILPDQSIKKIPSVDYIKTAVFSSLPMLGELGKSVQSGLTIQSIILYLLFFSVVYFLSQKMFTFGYQQIWRRYKHFIFSAIFLVFIFALFGKLIHTAEISLATETGIVSALSTYNLIDMYEWITIFAFTGYNGVVFPVSVLGQLISTFSHFIGIGTALFSVLAEIIFMKKQKKREAGEYAMKLSNHIVICGGNDQLHNLINNLEIAYKEYKVKLPKIVVIYPHFQELLGKSISLKNAHEIGNIEYIKGAVREESTLEAACISEAKMIYLLSEDKTVASDEKTLLRALSISRFCRTKHKATSNDDIDSAYMIAEISNSDFHDALINADVNEIVNSSDLSENLLIQSALNPGISKIISSLLTIDDGHEFYNIKISQYPKLADKNFDELLLSLRTKNILLISIQIGFFDKAGREIIDTDVINTKLKGLELSRQALINPYVPIEKAYKVNSNDSLVVLAESKTLLEKTLKTYEV